MYGPKEEGMKVIRLEKNLQQLLWQTRQGRKAGRGCVMGPRHALFLLKIFENGENPHYFYLPMINSLNIVNKSEFFTRTGKASAPWGCHYVFSSPLWILLSGSWYIFQYPKIHSVCHPKFCINNCCEMRLYSFLGRPRATSCVTPSHAMPLSHSRDNHTTKVTWVRIYLHNPDRRR